MPKKIQRDRMALISIHITKNMLDEIDKLVQRGLFPSRSEAIRAGVAMLLQNLCVQERRKQEEREFTEGLMRGR